MKKAALKRFDFYIRLGLAMAAAVAVVVWWLA